MTTFIHRDDIQTIARKTWGADGIRVMVGAIRTAISLGLVFGLTYSIASAPAQIDRLSFALKKLNGVPAVAMPSSNQRPNSLRIPSLGLDAPVQWEVPLSESLNGLQAGVVHAKETALPGQLGRTFVIGHSAGYWWNSNPWTKVFALLENTSIGDLVYLNYHGQSYTYRITEQMIISPSDVDVLTEGPNNRNQLALMTCSPVGTTLRRLIVLAEPVS